MASVPRIANPPPGPQRSSRHADCSGKIHFISEKAGIEGDTAYWIWGDLSSSRTALIALHGGPGATHSYMTPVSLIADDYGIPVIMYDQIGCGESTRFKERKGDAKLWTAELFIDELVNVIAWLRNEWKVSEYNLLGHSWGGRLGAMFAILRQPSALRKLIISNTTPSLDELRADRIAFRKTMPADIQDIFRRQGVGEEVARDEAKHALQYEFGLRACRFHPWPKELIASMVALEEDDTVYSTMLGFNMAGTLPKANDVVEDRLAEITNKTCPDGMLILSGFYESYLGNSMAKWSTQPICRVESMQFELSSHFVMFEEAEKYLEAIGRFLSEPRAL